MADRILLAKGPKGEMEMSIPEDISIKIEDDRVTVSIDRVSKKTKALHGTFRMLISNMITGVSEGWEKQLELVGTGYRAELSGAKLELKVGFSHPVIVEPPEGITFKVEKSVITVGGIDKELVGQVTANIRRIRPPEPYKGKGIRYVGEEVRRKPGKAAKAVGAAQ